MNISLESKDKVNAVIKIVVEKKDYENKVIKELKKQRKNIQVKGFRKGNAPLGLIKKMAGDNIKMNEIDKLLKENLTNFIKNNSEKLLGQPLPSSEQKTIDISREAEYEFLFDIGMASNFELNLNNKEIDYFKIEAEDNVIDAEIEKYQNYFTEVQNEEITSENSYLRGNIVQIDKNGDIVEKGINVEDIMLSVEVIKDSEIKEKFIGKKINNTIDFDIKKAYPNDIEIAAILKIDKKIVAEIQPYFQFFIKKITINKPSKLNQNFFDKVFGKDVVKDEVEFRKKITININENNREASYNKFKIDVKEKLLKDTNIILPDNFLKRWLQATDETGRYKDNVLEEQYPIIASDFRWQLIKEKIIVEKKLEITDEEIRNESRKLINLQLKNIGMSPQELNKEEIEKLIDNNLEKKEDKNNFIATGLENKIFTSLFNNIKLSIKEVTTKEFSELNKNI